MSNFDLDFDFVDGVVVVVDFREESEDLFVGFVVDNCVVVVDNIVGRSDVDILCVDVVVDMVAIKKVVMYQLAFD